MITVEVDFNFNFIDNEDILNINKCINGINIKTVNKLTNYLKGRNYKVTLLENRIEITNEDKIVMLSLFPED